MKTKLLLWMLGMLIVINIPNVLAEPAESPVVDLGTIVITPTRFEQFHGRMTSGTSVITREEIEASNAQSIPDILTQTVAVHMVDNSTSKSAVADIRGFGDTSARNVLVLINGRRVNAIDISAPDLVQVPIEAIERIEIIRGGASVFYGDNAIGGVINIITKKGEGELTGRIGSTYGSYDAQGADVEVSGEKNNVSYYVYSKYFDKRGYRANSDLLAKDFSTRLGYDFEDKVSIDLDMGWHEDVQELPGGLTDTQLATLGRKGSGNKNDTAYLTDRYVKLAVTTDPWPEDFYGGEFSVDFFYRNRDVYDEFNAFSAFHTKRSIDTTGVTGKYVFDHEVFGQEANFVVGVDYYDTENDILGSGSNVDDITIAKEELGIYGYMQYEVLDDIFFNGGFRYQRATYTFDQRNVAVYSEQKPDEWVWTGGMKYEYGKGSNVHWNVQKTFRFLATDEWYSTANFPGFGITPGLNLDLKHQTGLQYEMGIRHNFNDKVTIGLTPYYMDMEDEIFFDPTTFANSNYTKTRRIGVEFDQRSDISKFFDFDFLNKLEIFTNYTYQHGKFIKDASHGKYIPMVPRHQSTVGLVAQLFEHYNFSIIGKYIGSQFAVNDTLNETPPIKPYYVLDAKIAYKMKHFEVFAALNNMLNNKYSTIVTKSTTSSTKSHFPAPERNFTVGVNVKF